MTRKLGRKLERKLERVVELEVTALVAGGDGVGRDDGRVTFVPRTAPGDRARVRIVQEKASFARGELVEVVAAGVRVAPACPHFAQGCGGCAWQHVERRAQLAAKEAIAAGALRKLPGLVMHAIEDPAPPLGWRRRARFHVSGGRVGLFALGTRRVLPIAACPQLEPALDAARAVVAAEGPPDGELALIGGSGSGAGGDPACAVGIEAAWAGAAALVGRAGIRGVIAGGAVYGEPIVEVEPGLFAGPWDFAQASAAGNAALVARVLAAVGPPAGARRLLELYAGAGNFTRGLSAAGWEVLASDGAAPPRPVPWAFEQGPAAEVLARVPGPFEVIVLDPPRGGAPEAIEGVLRLGPPLIVYVSCDPATLARDAARLSAGGYRATGAWPIDLMPQTAHVEVVMTLRR